MGKSFWDYIKCFNQAISIEVRLGSRKYFDLIQANREIFYYSKGRGCLDRRFFHIADAPPQDWGEMACYREFNPAALSDDSAQNRRDEHTANASIPQAAVATAENNIVRRFPVSTDTEPTSQP